MKKNIAMTQTDNEKNPPKTLNNPTVCFILSVTTFAKEDVCLFIVGFIKKTDS